MQTRWSTLTKGIVTVASLVAAVWVLFRFSQLWPPLILAALLAYLINVPVSWIARSTGWPRWPFVLLFYLVIMFLLVMGSVRIYPTLASLTRTLIGSLQRLIETVTGYLARGPVVLFNFEIPTANLAERITGAAADLLSPFATGALSVAFGAATTVGWLLFILVVAFYLIQDSGKLAVWGRDRIPPAYQTEFRRLGKELADIWSSFIRGNITVGIIDGTVIAVLLAIFGVPNAMMLGLLVVVFSLVPSIGPLMAAVPAVLIALFQGSTYLPLTKFWFAVLVAGIYLVIFQIDNWYTVPRIVGGRLRLHPVLVIIGATGGAFLGGILGILLAAPVIASVRTLGGYVYRKLLDLDPFSGPAVPAGEGALADVSVIANRRVEALLFDLDGTLIESDDSLVIYWADRLAPVRKLLPGREAERTARWLAGKGMAVANGIAALLDKVGLDDETFAWRRRMRRGRGQEPGNHAGVVPGAAEAIRELARHYRLGVVSTRGQEEAQTLLQHEGLLEFFSVVIGCDTTKRLKPHPLPVREAARRLNVDATRCALVGDTSVDVRAAARAGAVAVAVLSGFGSRSSLRRADLILQDVAELGQRLSAAHDNAAQAESSCLPVGTGQTSGDAG